MLSGMTLRANIICAFGALLAAGTASSGSGQMAPSADTQALQRMAATERAFAAATAEIGIRDGFIFFFAPDAIQFEAPRGGPLSLSSAQTALAARPLPKLPLAGKLMWEPFTGHISSDGTLGWLTGGFVALDEAQKAVVSQGAYFSVWKRQPDGTFRVWIDEGVTLPDVWKDAAPFRVAPEPDASAVGAPGETVADVERSVASSGETWRARLAAGVRLHREAKMPFVGREAAASWATAAWQTVTYTTLKTEAAASGDLAVVVGSYAATIPAGQERGSFVRVWKRDTTGRWRIVFETSKARP
jgi:ketosteroid isomerase-like protein